MTNANMQLVVVSVLFDDKLDIPEPKLDPGEYIVTKIVELSKLSAELEGESRFFFLNLSVVIDAFNKNMTERYEIDKGCLSADIVNRVLLLTPVSHISPLACNWHNN